MAVRYGEDYCTSVPMGHVRGCELLLPSERCLLGIVWNRLPTENGDMDWSTVICRSTSTWENS